MLCFHQNKVWVRFFLLTRNTKTKILFLLTDTIRSIWNAFSMISCCSWNSTLPADVSQCKPCWKWLDSAAWTSGWMLMLNRVRKQQQQQHGGSGILHAHWQDSLGHLTLLMLIFTSVLFLLWQVRMSAVKRLSFVKGPAHLYRCFQLPRLISSLVRFSLGGALLAAMWCHQPLWTNDNGDSARCPALTGVTKHAAGGRRCQSSAVYTSPHRPGQRFNEETSESTCMVGLWVCRDFNI